MKSKNYQKPTPLTETAWLWGWRMSTVVITTIFHGALRVARPACRTSMILGLQQQMT